MKTLPLSMAIAGLLAASALPGVADASVAQPNISIPMCGLPNGTLIFCGFYNELAYAGETIPAGRPATFSPLTATNVGTTVAAVTANFPATLTWAFANNPYINIQVANLQPSALALLSHSYYVHTKGVQAPLLTAAAKRLSAINLYAFATAFSPAVFTPYVDSYTPATTKAQYLAYIAKTPPKALPLSQWAYDAAGKTAYTMNGLSTGSGVLGMPQHSAKAQAWYAAQTAGAAAAAITPDAGYVSAPLPTMALSDIWLEFYCAGVGTTYVEATVMAVSYSAPYVTLAGSIGYAIGTGIYDVAEELDPGYFEDMIEYMGTLWQQALTPTGTITVGEPYDTQFPDGSADTYDDFDACDGSDIC